MLIAIGMCAKQLDGALLRAAPARRTLLRLMVIRHGK